jgi:hypothetical protein
MANKLHWFDVVLYRYIELSTETLDLLCGFKIFKEILVVTRTQHEGENGR